VALVLRTGKVEVVKTAQSPPKGSLGSRLNLGQPWELSLPVPVQQASFLPAIKKFDRVAKQVLC